METKERRDTMQTKSPRASAGANKAISRRADEELFNRGNLDVADELFAPDFVYHDPAGEELRGPESVKGYATMLRAAFPDLHQTIEDQVAEGDRVAYRWTARGTHEGELMGIAPTGNRVTFTGIAVARLADGKIEEIWENYDALGLMQQLGAIPSPE
jgi:steroid delta-isomerase-like uncharacterized protein